MFKTIHLTDFLLNFTLLTIVHILKGCKFKLNNYFCRYRNESSSGKGKYL